MKAIKSRWVGALALIALLGACSDAAPTRTASEPAAKEAVSVEEKAAQPQDATEKDAQVQETDEQLSMTPELRKARKKDTGLKKPPPLPKLPFKSELPIEAWVEETCVKRGEKVILHVKAPHESAIAYQAVYSDGRAGTDEPMGAGYGGNDKGYGPPSGEWLSTWIVAPTAPSGPVRVDVFVGHSAKWGYEDPRFIVANNDGTCPNKKWLKGGDGQ